MSGRAQALMRTRCPACGTVFRVTSEQLRLKAGKVRCGHCHSVFNAFDEFLPEDHSPVVSQSGPSPGADEGGNHVPHTWPEIALPESFVEKLESSAVVESVAAELDVPPQESVAAEGAAADQETIPAEPEVAAASLDRPLEAVSEAASTNDLRPESSPDTGKLPEDELPGDGREVLCGPVTEPLPETQEESTQAARQAGLVAARELADSPAYNRWAAGALADGGASSFALPPARRLLWPFVVVALLLALGLLLQLLLHFRSEVVRWLPAAADYYQQAGISVPLPRNPDLVVIEASDLQADNARGLFVLQATLHNRATYAQDWPALELTLTDASDNVVARRVMQAAEYLPPLISPEVFPANGEVAVRLWIEARNLGAAGYRLYVFYP